MRNQALAFSVLLKHNDLMLNVRERREAQARREAAELIEEIGLHRAAELLNVHLTTVKRWHAGEVVAQTPVLIALRTLAGRWGPTCKDWEGWTMAENWLWSPTGDKFHPGDLLGRQYERQLIRYQRRQIAALEAKLRRVETGAANDPVEGDLLAKTLPR